MRDSILFRKKTHLLLLIYGNYIRNGLRDKVFTFAEKMTSQLLQPILNSAGVFLTMVEAVLVAYEVTNQYRGEKFRIGVGVSTASAFGEPVVVSRPPTETAEFSKWEKNKKLLMKYGLAAILCGGVLQIIASWICH